MTSSSLHLSSSLLSSPPRTSPPALSLSSGAPSSSAAHPRSEEDELVARLDLIVEIIEKEYAEFNARHSSSSGGRKQKRIVPRLFYAFYKSQLCAQFICACFEHLVQFVRSPVQEGERLDGSGPDARRGPAHDSNLGGKKLAALERSLQRVAHTWSAILMYRAEMNRYETLVVAPRPGGGGNSSRGFQGKKSAHFLNDTFDTLFFETLYLLVEYSIEWRFLDQTKPIVLKGQTPTGDQASTGAAKRGAATPVMTTSAANGSSAPSSSSTHSASDSVAPIAAVPAVAAKGKSSTQSAALLALEMEATWRLAQHELQRVFRSRNFNAATRARAPSADGHTVGGNGLHHVPLTTSALHSANAASNSPRRGNGASSGGAATKAHKHTSGRDGSHGGVGGGASYRSPATFRLGPAPKPAWDPSDPLAALSSNTTDEDDSTRALSHLPGHFKSKGGFGILDCLDLRSPIVASVLPNPRTMRASNESYVFGSEVRRSNAQARNHARLTHAESAYLQKQHASQAARALEWKMKIEREEQESEDMQQQQQMQQHSEGATKDMESGDAASSLLPKLHTEEHKESHSDAVSSSSLVPALQLQGLQPRPPAARGSFSAANAGSLLSSTLQPTKPAAGSASARARPTHVSFASSGSLTARAPSHLQPLSSRSSGARTPATARQPRQSIDEALSSRKPLVTVHGNKISLADFRI